MSRRVFSYGLLRIGVSAVNDSHLEWLAEFVRPCFGRSAGGESDVEVTLQCNRSRFKEILDRGATQLQVECFALDTRTLRLPVCGAVDGHLAVFDEEWQVFYLIGADSRTVEILTHQDSPSVRPPLMRVTREFAMNHAWRQGGVFLHAAAFALGERGILVAGPKGAGKTTLLFSALSSSSTSYLANDRVYTTLDGGVATLRGMPVVVTVRGETLDLFPSLRRAQREGRYRATRTIAESRAARPHSNPNQGDALGITPAQLCRLMNSGSVGSAPAATLLFPNITGQPGGLELRAISSASAQGRLQDSLFGSGARRTHAPLFAHAPRRPFKREDLEKTCRRVAAGAPAFICDMGLDIFSRLGPCRERFLDLLSR